MLQARGCDRAIPSKQGRRPRSRSASAASRNTSSAPVAPAPFPKPSPPRSWHASSVPPFFRCPASLSSLVRQDPFASSHILLLHIIDPKRHEGRGVLGASGVRVGGRRESESDAKCLDCVRGSRKGQRPGGKSSRDKEREDRRAALTNTGVKHLERGNRASGQSSCTSGRGKNQQRTYDTNRVAEGSSGEVLFDGRH